MFFGWEGVGVASYLLIGFWYKKPSANAAAIKAFIVNRVGDFGLAIGIFLIFFFYGTVNYNEVFQQTPLLSGVQLDRMLQSIHTMSCHFAEMTERL